MVNRLRAMTGVLSGAVLVAAFGVMAAVPAVVAVLLYRVSRPGRSSRKPADA
jgi:hypothetical protein